MENQEINSRRVDELLDSIELEPQLDDMADSLRNAVWTRVERRIERHRRTGRILRGMAAAVAVTALVCGSWIASHLATERAMAEGAQRVTLCTPLGVKSQTTLPDGTVVRLNGGSSLTYPAIFGRERRVEVDGEAFFDVARDEKHPFVVSAGGVEATVLGTSFNVNAYAEDEIRRITLVTGSLLVTAEGVGHEVKLHPGEQATVRIGSGAMELQEVNAGHAAAWYDNELHFVAEPLGSICRTLHRQFNVEIEIDDDLRDIRFTGEFTAGENIAEIMRVISADRRIRYSTGRNRIKIYKNNY